MPDNVDYLLLEHLKAIRGDLETIKSDLRDIKTHLETLLDVYLEVRLNLAE